MVAIDDPPLLEEARRRYAPSALHREKIKLADDIHPKVSNAPPTGL